jgi:hypothetical protein
MSTFHTIIGMPVSGKTTFLAALWHLITSAELDPALLLDHLEGDVHYLNKIVEVWQRCERLPRTSVAEDNTIILHLKDKKTGAPITLNFTDLSGETFHYQFTNRVCTPEYLAGLNGEGGVLLFVNADRPLQAITIMDAKSVLGDDAGEEQVVEWSPRFVSEQAQLVDLLQCLERAPFTGKRRRLAVIVSAWDVVTNYALPEAWLQTEMPLLAQFINTNRDYFFAQVYGVSAQGGDVESKRTELLEQLPSKRIRCVSPASDSSDITLPIRWLTGLENA